MDPATGAQVLVKVVEVWGASKTAEELGMSHAMASRYIASMDKWSGAW